jgi:hypothetical protein
MARGKCGLLWGSTHCTCQLTVLSISVLECGVILRLTLALTAYLQDDKIDQTLLDNGSLPCLSCIVLGTLKDNYDISASVFVVQFNGFMSLTS